MGDGEGKKGLKSIKENSTLQDLCNKLNGKVELTHLKQLEEHYKRIYN